MHPLYSAGLSQNGKFVTLWFNLFKLTMLFCYRVGLKSALRPTRKKQTISIATSSSAQGQGKQLFWSVVIYGYCWSHRSGWDRSWPLPSLRKRLPHSNTALCVKLTICWFRELTNKSWSGSRLKWNDLVPDLAYPRFLLPYLTRVCGRDRRRLQCNRAVWTSSTAKRSGTTRISGHCQCSPNIDQSTRLSLVASPFRSVKAGVDAKSVFWAEKYFTPYQLPLYYPQWRPDLVPVVRDRWPVRSTSRSIFPNFWIH